MLLLMLSVLFATAACTQANTETEAEQIAGAFREMWHMFVRTNPWPVRVYKNNQTLCDALALVSLYAFVVVAVFFLFYWLCMCVRASWRRWRPAAAKFKAE